MGRSCDFGICQVDATRVATFTAERGETKNKWACDLQHQMGVDREIRTQGWTPDWRILPGAHGPAPKAQP